MYLVLIVVAWMYIPSIDSLDCYSCSKVDNITSCQTMATCQNNEKCYTETNRSGNQSFYQLGCRPQDQCLKTVNQSPTIVGRSVANQSNCSICCSLDGCNRDLCGFDKQLVNSKAPCVDDPTFDCVKFGSLLNVCGDVQKAKLICRKYCGLCNLVDGAWTVWGSWGNCDVTCGPGHMTRRRACTNPAPEHGGSDCVGSVNESTSCNLKVCPINGQWSVWAAWESCSVTCDTGLQRRHRNCSNPSPSPDGHYCFGDNLDVRICSETQCGVVGHWASWDSWAVCTVTCGGGKELRGRKCTYPTGVPRGSNCTGDVSESRTCNSNACPVDGKFSDWSVWSQCSLSCGNGTQTHDRRCVYSDTAPHGAACTGNLKDQRPCNEGYCPTDGHWSAWSTYTSCSATCGGGTRTRDRTCVFQDHAPHGAQCFGYKNQKEDCNTNPCPVDGILTDWSSWTQCSATCGDGKQFRTRQCQFPSGVPHGNDCVGSLSVQKDCNVQVCPNDGEWSDWISWNSCSKSCDGGVQGRSRGCMFRSHVPRAAFCTGMSVDQRTCNNDSCPADGKLTDWSSWTQCSATCGDGKQFRTRHCQFPPGVPRGSNCTGILSEQNDCNAQVCPVDGVWSTWTDWSKCSSTCGTGTMDSTRLCAFPMTGAPHGDNCTGDSLKQTPCNNTACPVDGVWRSWQSWQSCSITCSDGTKTRIRECYFPVSVPHGKDCAGAATNSATCNVRECPVDGQWSIWQRLHACSDTCGGGTRTRTRDCRFPAHVTLVDGVWRSWRAWRSCSTTCGDGTKTRVRECYFPVSVSHGTDCAGAATNSATCNVRECPVDGQWETWRKWHPCTVTCGGGTRARTRLCRFTPHVPQGDYCAGNSSEKGSCNDQACPSIDCFVCDGPPQICATFYKKQTCPHPYCINELHNNIDGSKTLERRCGTHEECVRDWWRSSSDNDKCTGYDDTLTVSTALHCVFCCDKNLCNEPTVPLKSDLYKPT